MTTRRGRTAAGLAVLTLLGASACTGTEATTDPAGPEGIEAAPISARLVGHDSCEGLLRWFHEEGATRVGPYGLGGGAWPVDQAAGALESATDRAASSSAPSAAATAGDGGADAEVGAGSSATNTQEPGIGEPDLTWTDGTRLATIVGGDLQVVDLDRQEVTATARLDRGDGASPVGLLVEGEHVLVVSSGWATETGAGPRGGGGAVATDSIRPAGSPVTVLTRYDLGGTTPLGEITVEGAYVDARMVGGVVRAVVRSSPTDLGFVQPSGGSPAAVERATATNREVVAATTIGDWLPTTTVRAGADETTTPTVACDAVAHPSTFGGFDVVSVVGLDLAAGATEPLPATAVVAGGGTVYASDDHLYVSTTRAAEPAGPDGWTTPQTAVPATPQQGDGVTTEVHGFTLPAGESARYEASGSVPGRLLDQFALSQHEGDLRVATTTDPDRWSGPVPVEPDGAPATRATGPQTVSESRVTVLRREGDELAEVGRVLGLGPTEQIRGVRFAGPQAYVVTFRQTDPLYVVDLADPTAPEVAGELKIPGYSSYLQVVGEGRVLGIGQDADERGRTLGFQESLFDVADPTSPRRLDQLIVEGGRSTAEEDHHALLWWAPQQLLAVPVQTWGPTSGGDEGPEVGVLVTRVTDDGIERLGVITHGGGGTAPGQGGGACAPGTVCVDPMDDEPSAVARSWDVPIDRTLVADGRLVTVSSAGVKVSDLATLADQAWIPLG